MREVYRRNTANGTVFSHALLIALTLRNRSWVSIHDRVLTVQLNTIFLISPRPQRFQYTLYELLSGPCNDPIIMALSICYTLIVCNASNVSRRPAIVSLFA